LMVDVFRTAALMQRSSAERILSKRSKAFLQDKKLQNDILNLPGIEKRRNGPIRSLCNALADPHLSCSVATT
jgi:hypothetical protein